MPRSIAEGFRDFHARLTPSDTESEKASKHRASIEACLKNNFTLQRLFRTGSFGNGTSIYGYSDVDYFACVATSDLKENSGASLRRFREVLESRFPATGVCVDCPAVRVPFGTDRNEAHEITPADYVGASNGHSVYDIPDCAGGWMRSSPDAHNAYVRAVNDKLGQKVKPLIRFLKAWKYYRNVPISSFYLELRAAKYAAGESSIVYSFDVRNVLKQLHEGGLAQMQDPLGISGYVQPCRSASQLEEAQSKLESAATRAIKAVEAEHDGDIKTAFEWWNLLFNYEFPGYYY